MSRYWQPAELALLASMYPHCHSEDVAAWLGRRVSIVYQAANTRGLRKSDEYFASPCAGRMSRERAEHPNSVANRFTKGQPTWNKGRSGSETGTGTHPNCRRTQFKKGQAPKNTTLPLGTYRVNADGHLQRKVSEAHGSNSKRWRTVAELVWCEANGPLPSKHVVVFKPGKKTAVLEEITLDRVECISLAENMKRNSYHENYPPEVRKLVQLKGAITRQANRINREANEQPAHQ